jgi:hypothetical protein
MGAFKPRELLELNDALMEATITLQYGLLGFWTLSIVRYSKEHNVSETGSFSALRGMGGRDQLCWVC